jgi:hypothetical protein
LKPSHRMNSELNASATCYLGLEGPLGVAGLKPAHLPQALRRAIAWRWGFIRETLRTHCCHHDRRHANTALALALASCCRTAAFSRSQPTDSQYRRTSSRFCCKALLGLPFHASSHTRLIHCGLNLTRNASTCITPPSFAIEASARVICRSSTSEQYRSRLVSAGVNWGDTGSDQLNNSAGVSSRAR